jgi:hypothetical protein
MSETAARTDVGSGALFKNLKKEKETWPDYVGDITIKGVKYRLVGWKKEGQKGPYLSLSARPVEDAPPPAKAKSAAKPAMADEDF